MIRYLPPLLVGLVGCAILISLGVWQVQRLAWKESLLAEIEAKISATPGPLPAAPDPALHTFLPVEARGTVSDELRVLASVKRRGPGYRVISVLTTDEGRRILLDRGFRGVETKSDLSEPTAVSVTGNLHWPDEIDSFTPPPDLDEGLWFARDVPAMAETLDTEPTLLVARSIAPADRFIAEPLPVGTDGIPNDHLQYAVTWFSL
ncbi:MAG: SURF1 family protein, partial [Pseudomonadota bacterium]